MSISSISHISSNEARKAKRICGGVVVDVRTLDQALIAGLAGASGVDVFNSRGIKDIMKEVSIPVMARARQFLEAQVLESIGVEYIDITRVADENKFTNIKHNFEATFICGCRDLGEALRRIGEGSAVIRTQGDLNGSGDILFETVRSVEKLMGEIRSLNSMDEDEIFAFSERIGAPHSIVSETKRTGKLPVPLFASGGITTPADAALMIHLGCDGVFVGQEVFDCLESFKRIKSIVHGIIFYNNPMELRKASRIRFEESLDQSGSLFLKNIQNESGGDQFLKNI